MSSPSLAKEVTEADNDEEDDECEDVEGARRSEVEAVDDSELIGRARAEAVDRAEDEFDDAVDEAEVERD